MSIKAYPSFRKLASAFGKASLFSAVLFIGLFVSLRTLQSERVLVSESSSFSTREEAARLVELVKLLKFEDVSVKLADAAPEACANAEKEIDGGKSLTFRNYDGSCVSVSMSYASVFWFFLQNWLLFLVSVFSIVALFRFWNKYAYHDIDPWFLSVEDFKARFDALVDKIKKLSPDEHVLIFKTMDEMLVSSYAYVVKTSEVSEPVKAFRSVISHFESRHLMGFALRFGISLQMVQGFFYGKIGMKTEHFKNRFFFLVSRYNTSLWQLTVFTAVYIVINAWIMSVIAEVQEAVPFWKYVYWTVGLSDNLGSDIDMATSPIGMAYGIFVQYTGILIFGIAVTIVWNYRNFGK